jgi:hypothetical protein
MKRLALLLALLWLSATSAAQRETIYDISDDVALAADYQIHAFINTVPVQCVYGPWVFKVGDGYFVGTDHSKICVQSKTPVHMTQIATGTVLVWNDEGYVWLMAFPERIEWWERRSDPSNGGGVSTGTQIEVVDAITEIDSSGVNQ